MTIFDNLDITLMDGLVVVAAYLIGGISSGYLLVRVTRGIDVRSVGSHSTGATNVGRILGRKGFYLTLVGDLAKAALFVWLARWIGCPPAVVGLVAVALVVGHVWPAWLGFRGGKGIASSLGAFIALHYLILLPGAVVLSIIYLFTRNFLQSWVVAALLMPVFAILFDFPGSVILSASAMVIIVVHAHRQNIRDEWFRTGT